MPRSCASHNISCMGKRKSTACPNCRRLQQQLVALQARLAQVEQQLAAARKNSATSSKPPSSDIVKPTPPQSGDSAEARAAGGQPGHPKHERPLFADELVTATFEHRLDVCPDCGGALRPSGFEPRLVEQVDVTEPQPLHIERHRQHETYCPCCDKSFRGVLPQHIEKGGLLGPKLTALVAYLKGMCHASFSTVRKFLRDVVGVQVSRGYLVKVIAKVTAALQAPYDELLQLLPDEQQVNVDETGHKDRKRRFWTWCFRAELYTLFKISPTRSADVLVEVLGREFDGVLGCDFFGAYRRYMRECGVELQFCLAHFIREVKFLLTLPDPRDRAYGESLLAGLRRLFQVIHQRERWPAAEFAQYLRCARTGLLWHATHEMPATAAAGKLAKRLQKHGESYFRFITTPGVAPTNNLAEQAIRFVVIDRLITQGTRSDKGQRWCERIWTVIATCAQHSRSAFEFVSQAVALWFEGKPGPSLLESAAAG
jgi:transposase